MSSLGILKRLHHRQFPEAVYLHHRYYHHRRMDHSFLSEVKNLFSYIHTLQNPLYEKFTVIFFRQKTQSAKSRYISDSWLLTRHSGNWKKKHKFSFKEKRKSFLALLTNSYFRFVSSKFEFLVSFQWLPFFFLKKELWKIKINLQLFYSRSPDPQRWHAEKAVSESAVAAFILVDFQPHTFPKTRLFYRYSSGPLAVARCNRLFSNVGTSAAKYRWNDLAQDWQLVVSDRFWVTETKVWKVWWYWRCLRPKGQVWRITGICFCSLLWQGTFDFTVWSSLPIFYSAMPRMQSTEWTAKSLTDGIYASILLVTTALNHVSFTL